MVRPSIWAQWASLAVLAQSLWLGAGTLVCRAGDEGVADAVLQAESERIAAVAKAMPGRY